MTESLSSQMDMQAISITMGENKHNVYPKPKVSMMDASFENAR
jgi:hypothetical protein